MERRGGADTWGLEPPPFPQGNSRMSSRTKLSRWLQLTRWLLLGGLLGVASPGLADVGTCLDETGYALEELNSAARGAGAFEEATAGVSCDPPRHVEVSIASGSGTGIASYSAGPGVRVGTGALGIPNQNDVFEGRVIIEQTFEFSVVPDEPSATDPLPITIVARHRFGTVSTEVSGRGSAFVEQLGEYTLRQLRFDGPGVGIAPWKYEGPVPGAGEVVDIVKEVDVPVRTPLFFRAFLRSRSTAWGSTVGTGNSAASTLNSEVTYAIFTDAAASIVFVAEEPPGLDVLPAPEPETAWGQIVAAASLLALRRRSRASASSPATERT